MADNTTTDPSNPFAAKRGMKGVKEKLIRGWFAFATFFILLCFALIVGRITAKGAPEVFSDRFLEYFTKSPEILMVFKDGDLKDHRMSIAEYREFIEENPDEPILGLKSHNYSEGGIFGPLIGTILIVGICIVFAMFIGIAASVFLSEYSSDGSFINAVRLAILNLAGVPSIVFGLFGFAFFCYAFPVFTTTPSDRAFEIPFTDINMTIKLWDDFYLSFQGFGASMLSAGLTLAVMILPVIITACEQSLRAVPRGFREASLALGATQWQTIRKSVLPYALPGILTASVLGITRVAGETAPIMYTGAVATGDLPWENHSVDPESNPFLQMVSHVVQFFHRSVQAMPYHIYTVSAKIPQEEAVKPMQFGSVFIFMMIVMGLAALSIWMRLRMRSKLKW